MYRFTTIDPFGVQNLTEYINKMTNTEITNSEIAYFVIHSLLHLATLILLWLKFYRRFIKRRYTNDYDGIDQRATFRSNSFITKHKVVVEFELEYDEFCFTENQIIKFEYHINDSTLLPNSTYYLRLRNESYKYEIVSDGNNSVFKICRLVEVEYFNFQRARLGSFYLNVRQNLDDITWSYSAPHGINSYQIGFARLHLNYYNNYDHIPDPVVNRLPMPPYRALPIGNPLPVTAEEDSNESQSVPYIYEGSGAENSLETHNNETTDDSVPHPNTPVSSVCEKRDTLVKVIADVHADADDLETEL